MDQHDSLSEKKSFRLLLSSGTRFLDCHADPVVVYNFVTTCNALYLFSKMTLTNAFTLTTTLVLCLGLDAKTFSGRYI
jgi:hypothetical protein